MGGFAGNCTGLAYFMCNDGQHWVRAQTGTMYPEFPASTSLNAYRVADGALVNINLPVEDRVSDRCEMAFQGDPEVVDCMLEAAREVHRRWESGECRGVDSEIECEPCICYSNDVFPGFPEGCDTDTDTDTNT